MIDMQKSLQSLSPGWQRAFWLLLFIVVCVPALRSFVAPQVPVALTVAIQIAALIGMLLVLRRAGAVRLGYVVAFVAVPLLTWLLLRAGG